MEFEICLDNLRFYAYHGVMEEEGRIGNEFIVTLCIRIKYNEALVEDSIEDTVSYVELYDILSEEMQKRKKLLETVAIGIVRGVKQKFPEISSGYVKIEKVRPPIPGMLGSASVTLKF